MKVTTLLVEAWQRVLDGVRGWGPGPRDTWCREQRHVLAVGHGSVVWVRGEAVEWARWGARRGYFDVQFMDGLPYLRARGTPPM